jgi:alpha-ribazole phosphatase/probable phosphoglycerate mutase
MQHDMVRETNLWLLRHPEPGATARGRCYGSLDVTLSSVGIEQAHAVAKALSAQPLAAIYTSPRRRCAQAAAILARDRTCPVEIVEDLRELDFGEFEGRTYDEIAAQYPDLYRQWMERPTGTRFPGGECFGDMCVRVLESTSRLRTRHEGESIAIVAHGGVNRIVLADTLGMDMAHIFRIGQRYGALNLIQYFGNDPVVEMINSRA